MPSSELERRFGASNGYPLLNRAIQGQYPPGSTYKPWIALSALKRARERPRRAERPRRPTPTGARPCGQRPFDEDDPAAIQYEFHNWTTREPRLHEHRRRAREVLRHRLLPDGLRVLAAVLPSAGADGVEGQRRRAAASRSRRTSTGIGFGRVTNIDLPFEHDGRVPTRGVEARHPPRRTRTRSPTATGSPATSST